MPSAFSMLSSALPMPPRGYRLRVKRSRYGNIPGIGTATLACNWTAELTIKRGIDLAITRYVPPVDSFIEKAVLDAGTSGP